MDFDKVIKKRTSIRKFSSKKIKDEKLMEILEFANLAPSPGNIPIINYLIVEEPKNISMIANACQQKFIESASQIILVCSNSSQCNRLYDIRSEKYIKQHAGAIIENILLKITNERLASCWVGAFAEDLIKMNLNIPENIEIQAILPVGYPVANEKTTQKRKPRLQGRVFFESYGNAFKKQIKKIGET